MPEALRIAVLGAESTGKTTLAAALAAELASTTGRRVAWVAEHLREWCDARGRTPRADEQAAIARVQHERIEAAAAAHDIVIADTTALATAIYSRLLFADTSLEADAVERQRGFALTLLTALDLPWQADGLQRDGPHVRAPVDDALRELLIGHRLPFAIVGGRGAARLASARSAVEPLLRRRPARGDRMPPAGGLFTRLAAADDANAPGPAGNPWRCECCVAAEYEPRLREVREVHEVAAGGAPANRRSESGES